MSLLAQDFPAIADAHDVAKALGVSVEMIRRHVREDLGGIPPYFVVGNSQRPRVRFRRADVEAWLQTRIRAAA